MKVLRNIAGGSCYISVLYRKRELVWIRIEDSGEEKNYPCSKGVLIPWAI
jgi:hypothetical protein